MLAANHYGIGWLGLFGIALAVGTALGLLNALLVTGLRIASIIVTIAMLNVYYGLLMFVTGGDTINSLPDWFANGLSWVVAFDSHQNPYILNMQMIGLVLAFIMTWLLLNRTSVGRQLRALGAIRRPLSGSASTCCGSIWSPTVIWVSWRALPRWCRRKSRRP